MKSSMPQPDDSGQLGRQRAIDRLCDHFEQACKAGHRPRIEDYLAQARPQDYDSLLRELILLEVAYRRKNDLSVNLHDYRRFAALDPRWLASALEAPPKGALANRTPTSAAPEWQELLSPPLEAGELGRLGPYRVLRALGAGGMGVVFLAEDPKLKRQIAVKAMLPWLADIAEHRHRFLREAQAAAALDHDHIVPIYQVGEERNVPYLAMPLLKGETLHDRLKRERTLPVSEVLRLGREIALGLAAAHGRGLVHRDIKPGNIFLEARDAVSGPVPSGGGDSGGAVNGPDELATSDSLEPPTALDSPPETPQSRPATHPSPSTPRRPPIAGSASTAPHGSCRVKILDFGLARLVQGGTGLTQKGDLLGTPAFMSPEQANGETVDARSDLFSLGCVLYRMATGEDAFRGKDTRGTLAAVMLKEPRPPKELNPALPEELIGLILRLLAKDPRGRPQSARVVATELANLEKGSQEPEQAAYPRARLIKRGAPGSGAGRQTEKRPPRALPTAHPQGKTTAVAREKTQPATAIGPPPERWRHLIHSRAFWVGTTVVALFALVLYRFTPTAILIVTNKGELVVQTDRNVEIILSQGGSEVRTLQTGAGKTFPIAAGAYQALIIIHDTDGTVIASISQEIIVKRGDRQDFNIEQLLAEYKHARERGISLDLDEDPVTRPKDWLQDEVKRLGDDSQRHWTRVEHVGISPNGKWVASSGFDGVRLWDASNMERVESWQVRFGECEPVAFSPDGKWLAVGTNLWQITAEDVQRVTSLGEGGDRISFSADGKALAFGFSLAPSFVRVWDLSEPTRKSTTIVGAERMRVQSLACGIEGKLVAAAEFERGKPIHLWELQEGKWTERAPLAVSNEIRVHQLALAADGTILVAGCEDQDRQECELRAWDLTGPSPTALKLPADFRSSGMIVAFTPTGQTLFTGKPQQGLAQFWTVTKNGIQLKSSLERFSIPHRPLAAAFSGDGKKLVTGGSEGTVRLFDIESGRATERFPLKGIAGPVHSVTFAPDARTLVAGNETDIRFWDLSAKPPRETKRLVLPERPVPGSPWVSYSSDGKRLLSRHAFWDPSRPERPVALHDGVLGACSPTEAMVGLSPYYSKELWLYDISGDQLMKRQTVNVPCHAIELITFSPNGKTIYVGTDRGTIHLYDVSERSPRVGPVLKAGGEIPIWAIAFAPDGGTMVSAGNGAPVKVWEVREDVPREVAKLEEGLYVNSLAISKDGNTLAVATTDQRVMLWDLPARKRLREWKFPGPVRGVSFSRDGRYLATGNSNGAVSILDVDKRD